MITYLGMKIPQLQIATHILNFILHLKISFFHR